MSPLDMTLEEIQTAYDKALEPDPQPSEYPGMVFPNHPPFEDKNWPYDAMCMGDGLQYVLVRHDGAAADHMRYICLVDKHAVAFSEAHWTLTVAPNTADEKWDRAVEWYMTSEVVGIREWRACRWRIWGRRVVKSSGIRIGG